MKIIDFRLRPPYKGFTKDWMFNMEDAPCHAGIKTTYARKGYEIPDSIKELSMERLLHEMDASNVLAAAVPVRKLPGLDNEDLEELLRDYPERFIGLAGMQPNHNVEAVLSEIDQYIVKGRSSCVFMEPGLDPEFWYVDDEQFYPIYEKCQNEDIPICFIFGGTYHKSKSGLDYDIYKPTLIEHVLTAFPKLRVLLSHAALPWTTMACMCALNYDNLYLSPDFYLVNTPGCQDYIAGANYFIQDKIIFGSCYPAAPISDIVKGYQEVLRPQVWDKVFYQNALRALGEKNIPKCVLDKFIGA